MDEADDLVDFDIAEALGADGDTSPQYFAIYIPNKDQHGEEFGAQRRWVLEASRLLTEINGGATAMPPVEGAWINNANVLVWEQPVIVYSYLLAGPFLENLTRIREFLHRLGRETDQGEIGFEFGGEFFRIRSFDEP